MANNKKINNLNEFQSNPVGNVDENTMRNELERGFEAVKTENNVLESQKITVNNQIKQLRMEILQNFYKFLRDNEVDPGNLESINQFLQKLEEINPDFVDLFEFLLNGLDTSNQPDNSSEGMDNQNNDNMPTPDEKPFPDSEEAPFLKRFNSLKSRNII